MSSVTGFGNGPIHASKHCGTPKILDQEPLSISESFNKLVNDYSKDIERQKERYKNSKNTIEEVDAQISQNLSTNLDGNAFTHREAIAKAVMLTGRRSLITATKAIWTPIWERLNPLTQLFFGIHARTIRENFDLLMQLVRLHNPTQEQGVVCLAEILNSASIMQGPESRVPELNQFQATPALRKQLLECLRRVDHVYFVNTFLRKLNGSAKKIHTHPLLKEALEKFLPLLGDYLREIKRTFGTQTLYLGACQMGFLRDNPIAITYLVSQLDATSAVYNEVSPDPYALARLASLTLGISTTAIAFSDQEKQKALTAVCKKVLELAPEELNKVFIPQLAKSLEYSRQFKYFLEVLAREAVNGIYELDQAITLIETIYLPMIEHMGENVKDHCVSFKTIILTALGTINNENVKTKSDIEKSWQIVNLVTTCVLSIEKQSQIKANDIHDKQIAAVSCILDVLFKKIAPDLTLEEQEEQFASIISKVSKQGISLDSDGIDNFIKKIASVLDIDQHYRKITKDDKWPDMAARNPSMILYLNECLKHSTCEVLPERLQAFADRVYCMNHVNPILEREKEIAGDYLQLFSSLQMLDSSIKIQPDVAMKILHESLDGLSKESQVVLFANMLLSCIFFPDWRPKDEEVVISPEVNSKERKKPPLKFAPLEYRLSTLLEKWLKASGKFSSLVVTSRVQALASYLIKNFPVNFNPHACAESILPHYPDLAIQLIRLGSNFLPPYTLLINPTLMSPRIPNSFSKVEIQAFVEKKLKKALQTYSSKALSDFKEYARETSLKFEDWNNFVDMTLVQSYRSAEQMQFIDDIREELSKMFP